MFQPPPPINNAVQQSVRITPQQSVRIPLQQSVRIPLQQSVRITPQQSVRIPLQQSVRISLQQSVRISPATVGAHLPSNSRCAYPLPSRGGAGVGSLTRRFIRLIQNHGNEVFDSKVLP
ncbi:MAG: hypothetical protein IKQ77_12680 [Prevotella sp.]|nr:hypothetical protein [Prevotella sp.]